MSLKKERIMDTFSHRNEKGQPLRVLLLSLLFHSMAFLFFLVVMSTAARADISTSPALPSGYEVLMQGGRPCRLPGKSPLLIYSNDDRFHQVFQFSVEIWNSAARIQGIAPPFACAASPSEADVTLDWSGQGLPSSAAGAVWWLTGEGVERVRGITMEPNTRIPEGNLAEILIQELGHVTGLGHSRDDGDIMHLNISPQRYPYLSSVHLSTRDMQAFAWLYSQQTYVPIIGVRQAP
jgi:hypothetical protein